MESPQRDVVGEYKKKKEKNSIRYLNKLNVHYIYNRGQA